MRAAYPVHFILLDFFTLIIEVSRSQWPLAYWDCGFESRREHGCLSLVSVVCCQSSLRRADHSFRGVLPSMVCLSVIVKPRTLTRPRPPRGCRAIGKKMIEVKRTNYAAIVMTLSSYSWHFLSFMSKHLLSTALYSGWNTKFQTYSI
jgi:hypothetical protein